MDPVTIAMQMVVDRGVSTQQERDVADWTVVADLIRHMAEYGPSRDCPMPRPNVAGFMRLALDDARGAAAEDHGLGRAFGDYRVELTDWEAQEAQKLYRLGHAVQTLMRVRARAVDHGAVDKALAAIGDWVARAWRTDVPLRGDVRTWSVRFTRRYDLMSREWREF